MRDSGGGVRKQIHSFSKFVGILTYRSLYFARCDQFDDIFEGALGPLEERPRAFKNILSVPKTVGDVIARACQEFKDGTLKFRNDGTPENYPDNLDKTALESLLLLSNGDASAAGMAFASRIGEDIQHQMQEKFQRELNSTFISCWHAAEHESEAMWRLYSKDTIEGVAIKTSIGRLRSGIARGYSLSIRFVIYRDDYLYDLTDKDTLIRFCTKRKAFDHEREVRALITDEEAGKGNQTGISVPADLSSLIEMVVLSPYAPPWFADIVKESTGKFGMPLPVHSSGLKAKPFHY
jgi:hypothetical protein